MHQVCGSRAEAIPSAAVDNACSALSFWCLLCTCIAVPTCKSDKIMLVSRSILAFSAIRLKICRLLAMSAARPARCGVRGRGDEGSAPARRTLAASGTWRQSSGGQHGCKWRRSGSGAANAAKYQRAGCDGAPRGAAQDEDPDHLATEPALRAACPSPPGCIASGLRNPD